MSCWKKAGKISAVMPTSTVVEPGRDALQLVRWAKAEKGEITVSGRLKDDGIEIRYMMYKGDTVTPYYKPSDHFMFPGRPGIR